MFSVVLPSGETKYFWVLSVTTTVLLLLRITWPCPGQCIAKTCKECIVLGWLDEKQNQCITHPVSFGLAFSVLHDSKKNTFVQFTHKGRGRMYLSCNITLCNEKYQNVSLPCACKHMETKAALVFHGNCSF